MQDVQSARNLWLCCPERLAAPQILRGSRTRNRAAARACLKRCGLRMPASHLRGHPAGSAFAKNTSTGPYAASSGAPALRRPPRARPRSLRPSPPISRVSAWAPSALRSATTTARACSARSDGRTLRPPRPTHRPGDPGPPSLGLAGRSAGVDRLAPSSGDCCATIVSAPTLLRRTRPSRFRRFAIGFAPMTSPTGQDIESVCSKCGTSWHIVVAMVGERIAKVECKQCHSIHKHRGAKAPRKAAGATSAKKATRAVVARSWVQADPSKPVRVYATDQSFVAGERVEHSKFGLGVVQRSPGPGRVEILFGEELKLLTQAKPSVRRFSS